MKINRLNYSARSTFNIAAIIMIRTLWCMTLRLCTLLAVAIPYRKEWKYVQKIAFSVFTRGYFFCYTFAILFGSFGGVS